MKKTLLKYDFSWELGTGNWELGTGNWELGKLYRRLRACQERAWFLVVRKIAGYAVIQ
ncbi:MAG: hypothetical protein ACTTI6_00700 [Treponema sp.]|uniref:hypothetical protein n=1 Tax=Treponema sp. TaxID=166 RepID=UPI003FA28CBC